MTCYDNIDGEVAEDVPKSADDLFSLHFSFLEKLCAKEADGGVQRMKDIRHVLSQVKVFSLFSGLGGAELCVEMLFNAVSRKCGQLQIAPPQKPKNLLSCDSDAACRKVLSQHRHRSDHIVDDMNRFLAPHCFLASLYELYL